MLRIKVKERKCTGCGAYRGTHAPLCPKITGAYAKRLLVMYYESWLALELQRRQFKGKPIKKREGCSGWVFCPICGKRDEKKVKKPTFIYYTSQDMLRRMISIAKMTYKDGKPDIGRYNRDAAKHVQAYLRMKRQ